MTGSNPGTPSLDVTLCSLSPRYIFPAAPPHYGAASSSRRVGGPSARWSHTCNKTIYMLANTHISAQSAAVIWIMVLDLFSQLFTPPASSHISRRLATALATHHSHTSRPASQFKHCQVAARLIIWIYVRDPTRKYIYGSDGVSDFVIIDCRTKKLQRKHRVASIMSWTPVDRDHVSSEQKAFWRLCSSEGMFSPLFAVPCKQLMLE